jgi:hypothetical protein
MSCNMYYIALYYCDDLLAGFVPASIPFQDIQIDFITYQKQRLQCFEVRFGLENFHMPRETSLMLPAAGVHPILAWIRETLTRAHGSIAHATNVPLLRQSHAVSRTLLLQHSR